MSTAAASAEHEQGYAKAQAHFVKGHYRPNESNPHALSTREREDWRAGYEAGWDAAFWRKHARDKQEASLFF